MEGGPQRGQFHHKRILEAMERREPEMARAAMAAHLEQVREDSQLSSGGKPSGKHTPARLQNPPRKQTSYLKPGLSPLKAAILKTAKQPLQIEEMPQPQLAAGQVLLRVRACGICPHGSPHRRGRIAVTEGSAHSWPPNRWRHRRRTATAALPLGARVGVSWMGGIDGDCPYCRRGLRGDLLRRAGVHRIYRQWCALCRICHRAQRFCLCASRRIWTTCRLLPFCALGIIGFRSLRVAGVEPGDRVGLFGFGAHPRIWRSLFCAPGAATYMSRPAALPIASWPPLWERSGWAAKPTSRRSNFDRAGHFCAQRRRRDRRPCKPAQRRHCCHINAIHLDRIPEFDYDRLLWGERQIRSVAKMTRSDARDVLEIATDIRLQPKVTVCFLWIRLTTLSPPSRMTPSTERLLCVP